MSKEYLFGLVGIPCFIIACVFLSYYKEIKKSRQVRRDRIKKFNAIKKEREERKQFIKDINETQALNNSRKTIFEESSVHTRTPAI